MHRRANTAATLSALALMSFMAMSPSPATANDDDRTVSVTATGSVEAAPDRAVYSTGVMTEAATAREALTENSTRMANVIDGLKGLGIAAKDIQTQSLNIMPRHTSNSASSRDGRAPTISGYQVVNSVRIVVKDLKRLGEVLDKAVSLGANYGGGIQFAVSNEETLLDKARELAMENALRRAQLFAKASNTTVHKVLTISEGGGHIPVRPMVHARAAMAASSVPVESGSETLTATVTVTYELK